MIPKNESRFQQLEVKKQRLIEELSTYPHDTLTLPEKEGAWSVIECIHHLYITEWGTDRYIRKKTQQPELIPATSLAAVIKLLALKYSFATPIKFKAPAILPKPPVGATLDQIDEDWTAARKSFHELMEELPAPLQQRGIFRHPIAGRLSMAQTLDFFDFHFDRHERQVHRILKAVVR